MKIKICGVFREEDIDYVNEARPDFAGFVFAPSRRQVPAELAARLRSRLAEGIEAVGVFIDAPVADVITLYRDGVISLAQLHGTEDAAYVARLKKESGAAPIPVIKVIKSSSANFTTEKHGERKEIKTTEDTEEHGVFGFTSREPKVRRETPCTPWFINSNVDYYLFDSGSGSGKAFDWGVLNSFEIDKPWFLAGGIGVDNIEKALVLNPFAVDVSSGAETTA